MTTGFLINCNTLSQGACLHAPKRICWFVGTRTKAVVLLVIITLRQMKLPIELLEEGERKILVLRKAIKDGIDSGVAKDFNPKKYLALLKNRMRKELTNKLN
jgi:hypothetical protein